MCTRHVKKQHPKTFVAAFLSQLIYKVLYGCRFKKETMKDTPWYFVLLDMDKLYVVSLGVRVSAVLIASFVE